jgi:hypothetical protein
MRVSCKFRVRIALYFEWPSAGGQPLMVFIDTYTRRDRSRWHQRLGRFSFGVQEASTTHSARASRRETLTQSEQQPACTSGSRQGRHLMLSFGPRSAVRCKWRSVDALLGEVGPAKEAIRAVALLLANNPKLASTLANGTPVNVVQERPGHSRSASRWTLTVTFYPECRLQPHR